MTRTVPGKSQFAGKTRVHRVCANPSCRRAFATSDPRQRYCSPTCNHRAVQARYRLRRKEPAAS